MVFADANKMLDDAAVGRDPFANKTGDLKKAYRSEVDQTLQSYRLFIPSTYDSKKPTPIVIVLHGMGGDESSMFDGYSGAGALKKEAEKHGFVLAEVQRDYKAAPKRIYIVGHSKGGYGKWSIAMAHPEIFADLGLIAGGGDPRGMGKIRHIPSSSYTATTIKRSP